MIIGQRHALGPLYPRQRPDTPCKGGWVGSSGGLGRCEKKSPPPRDFFSHNFFFIGTYTLQMKQVDPCVPYWSLCVILYIVSPPGVVYPWGVGRVCCPNMSGTVLSPFSPPLTESVREGGTIVQPGTFLLWVSWVLGGTLSSGLVAGNPSSR